MDNYWYNFKVNFNSVDNKNQNEIDSDFKNFSELLECNTHIISMIFST